MSVRTSAFRIATIADGQTVSGEVDVLGYEVVAVQQAANTEGTTWTFQGSLDGSTFATGLNGDGTEISIPKSATAAEIHILKVAERMKGLSKLKIVSGAVQSGEALVWIGLVEIV